MPKMPIDPNRVTFVAGGPAEPVVKNRDTGELATDRVTKQTMFQLHLTVFLAGESKPEVWTVKVAGQPPAISQGERVMVTGLMGSDWENNGRHGVSFRAESIAPVGASKAPAPPKAA
jgi:hypothetical protein